jgi:hypothetical protein
LVNELIAAATLMTVLAMTIAWHAWSRWRFGTLRAKLQHEVTSLQEEKSREQGQFVSALATCERERDELLAELADLKQSVWKQSTERADAERQVTAHAAEWRKALSVQASKMAHSVTALKELSQAFEHWHAHMTALV